MFLVWQFTAGSAWGFVGCTLLVSEPSPNHSTKIVGAKLDQELLCTLKFEVVYMTTPLQM